MNVVAESVGFLPRKVARKLDPNDVIQGTMNRVIDYWKWAHNDILENVQRGSFAEFLVASALGVTERPRVGWTGFDLLYGDIEIEVKASAFLQSWDQRALYRPQFNIGPRRQYDPVRLVFETEPRYIAKLFVFCLFADTDHLTAEILDVDRWRFFVVKTSTLVTECAAAKKLTLKRLEQFAKNVSFAELQNTVDQAR